MSFKITPLPLFINIQSKAVLCVTVCSLFASCSKNGGDVDGGKQITVPNETQLTQEVYADKTEGKSGVTFTTAGAWTSTITEATASKAASPDWVSISPSSGDAAGTFTINITLNENYSGEGRSAKIEIICGDSKITITIGQKGTTAEGKIPDVPTPSGGISERITIQGTGSNAKLVFASDPTDAGLYFKYGSIVGIYSAHGANQILPPGSNSDKFHNDDIAFNPSRMTTYNTWDEIPYANAAVNINTAYHTLDNVKVGRGDPCRLVGYTAQQIKDASTVLDNKTWRMPTKAENAMFVGDFVSLITPTSYTNSNYPYWSTVNGVSGGAFPVIKSGSKYVLNTDPANFLPAAGYRSSGTVTNMGTEGVYWSSEFNNSALAHALNLSSGNVSSINSGSVQSNGLSVRCVSQSEVSFSPASLSFGASDNPQTLSVTSNASWSVSSDQAWCTVSPASGINDGSVAVTVVENTSTSSRTAALTFKTTSGAPSLPKTLIVAQAGEPSLSISTSELNYSSGGNSQTFAVTSNGVWNVSSNQSWCTVTPAGSSNNGNVTVTVAANPSESSRTATVTVQVKSGTYVRAEIVTIKQEASVVGSAPRISVEGSGDNAKLVITTNPSDAGLFFKFGSVVGIYSGSGRNAVLPQDAGISKRFDSGDIAFNPTATISFSAWNQIPYVTVQTNINSDFHTLANVKAGKGDPCRLVGYTAQQIKNATVVPDNKTWKLPTNAENKTFSGYSEDAFGISPVWWWSSEESPFMGVAGAEFPSRNSGGGSNFLPATGARWESGMGFLGAACYWSCECYADSRSFGLVFQYIGSSSVITGLTAPLSGYDILVSSNGNPVRCVRQ